MHSSHCWCSLVCPSSDGDVSACALLPSLVPIGLPLQQHILPCIADTVNHSSVCVGYTVCKVSIILFLPLSPLTMLKLAATPISSGKLSNTPTPACIDFVQGKCCPFSRYPQLQCSSWQQHQPAIADWSTSHPRAVDEIFGRLSITPICIHND